LQQTIHSPLDEINMPLPNSYGVSNSSGLSALNFAENNAQRNSVQHSNSAGPSIQDKAFIANKYLSSTSVGTPFDILILMSFTDLLPPK